MDNCERYKGKTRPAVAGDDLFIATGSHRDRAFPKVIILVSATDPGKGDDRVNVCIDKHQVDIQLSRALQAKLNLEGHDMVRCTGAGHDSDLEHFTDGFYINGHEIEGRRAFLSLEELRLYGYRDVVISVLPEDTPMVSTFVAHPKRRATAPEVVIIQKLTPATSTVRSSVNQEQHQLVTV